MNRICKNLLIGLISTLCVMLPVSAATKQMIGPATASTDNAIVTWNGVDAFKTKNSTVIVNSGDVSGVKTFAYGKGTPNIVSLGTVSGGGTATLTGTNSTFSATFSGATATIALPATPSDGTWLLHGIDTYNSGNQIITVPSLIRPEYNSGTAITTFTNSASTGRYFTVAFTAQGGSFVKFSVVGDAYVSGGSSTVSGVYTVINAADSPYSAPTDGSDATSAIQAALDAAQSTKARVFLPKGTYTINGTLYLAHGVGFEGQHSPYGSDGTVLSKTGTGPCIVYTNASYISGFYISGTGAANQQIGISSPTDSASAADWKIENVRMYGLTYGMWIHNTWVGEINSCFATTCGTGLAMSNTVNQVKVYGGEYTSNTNGITIEGTSCNGIYISSTFQSSQRGITTTGDFLLLNINGSYFESQTVYDVFVGDGRAVNIENCTFDSGSITNIYLDSVSNSRIAHNGFLSYTTAKPFFVSSSCTQFIYSGNYYDGPAMPWYDNAATSIQISTNILAKNVGGPAVIVDGGLSTRVATMTLANGSNTGINAGGASYDKVSGPTGAFTINGIAGGYNGYIVTIVNLTGQTMTVAHESGTEGTAANRITSMTGADLVSTGNSSATLIYDTGSSRWVVIQWNP